MMTYTYKKRDIYIQGITCVMFILFGIMVGNAILLAVLGFFTFLLFKDCLKMSKTTFVVKGDRLEIRVGENVDRTLLYREFQFITRTRRNKKWVVIGRGGNIVTLRPSISGFNEMVEAIISYNKSNKKIFIHESLLKIPN